MRLRSIGVLGGLILGQLYGQTACVNFPAGFIPFSSIYYVTAANSAGDHLVVGVPAPGFFSTISADVPTPAFTNQTFCDAQVQLAPGQSYPNVYVPTAAELAGMFQAFSGLLINPATNQPYANGVIPESTFNTAWALRIGPAQAGSANGGWSPTGSMTETQSTQAAALLPSGQVLVANPDQTANLYDPATGAFTSVGPMHFAHGGYLTATLLNNGQVLIVGGLNLPSAAELYNPQTGQFTATGATVQPHGYFHTATPLNDGRVLVVGGDVDPAASNLPTDISAGAETYDPATGIFTKAGPMVANRNRHTATLLADGRVLIAGGYALGGGGNVPGQEAFDSGELYAPSTGSFSSTFPMTQARGAHYAVLLANGEVLLGGGDSSGGSAELFDPGHGAFTATGSMSNSSRSVALAALLSNGQALIAGGKNGEQIATNSTELYGPATGAFTTTGSMGCPRAFFALTPLLDGRLLATGGNTGGSPWGSKGSYNGVFTTFSSA